MTQMIAAFSDISFRYRAVFCDLWGCLHNGKTAYPAAVAALQAFRAQGGTVVLMTNAPRPFGSVAAQLERIGAPRDCYDFIVSSGDAAQHALVTGAVGFKVHYIGAEKDMPFFTDLPPPCRLSQPRTRSSNSCRWPRPKVLSAPACAMI